MTNKQIAYLPVIAQINENIIKDIPVFLKRNSLYYKNVLVVSGSGVSQEIANIILNALDASQLIIESNSGNGVERICEFSLMKKVDLIIGVGGGTILDLVKRGSLLCNIENLLVPTVISNDGLTSPIAVIKDENGKSSSLQGKLPMGIVVDLDIVSKAPRKFLQAAAGDILSNMSATNDWVLANQNKGEEINDVAYMLSRSAAHSLLHNESKDLGNRNFLKQIIYCQINSGLAMALAGTSRPCSGSEHLISHAIDYLNLSDGTLHGLQVGSISIFCLFLQNKLDAKCLNYAYELDIPYAFGMLNEEIYKNIKDLYEVSLTMRPGRFTVLDLCKYKSFDNIYNDFIAFLNRFK